MTDVRMTLVPATIGSIALAWFASDARSPDPQHWAVPRKPSVEYRGASLGTFSETASGINRAAIVPAGTASLMAFYSRLMADQQDLGREFEQVLFENIWDLYAR
jgi:hypothetical protein